MKLLSFVVTVYNQEEYIEECINSLLPFLSFANIIVVDDGSNDNSLRIIERFKKREGINVVHQSNRGVSVARNRALAYVRTPYVTFVDGDDCVEFLDEDIVQILLSENWDIIQYPMLFNWGSEYEILKSFSCEIFDRKKYLESYIDGVLSYSCCNKIFKTNLFDNHCFIEGKRYEDVCLLLSLTDVVRKVKIVDYGKYLYRFNNASFTLQKTTYNKIFDFIYMAEFWIKQVQQYQISEYWEIRLKIYLLIEFSVFHSSLPILHLISPYILTKKECLSCFFQAMPFRSRCFLLMLFFVGTSNSVLLMSKIYKIKRKK